MLDYNGILDCDSYKSSHYLQTPDNTTAQFSYIESRGGLFDTIVVFGYGYILRRYLSKPITAEMINEAETEFKLQGMPFNREGWEYILNEHNGKLPIRIRAMKEGTVATVKSAIMTIESTDPKCSWIVGYLEPMLLRIWYPITVSTLSYHIMKDLIIPAVVTTSEDTKSAAWKLHDFGARASTSYESSMIAGAAHLLSFSGSDTVAAHRLIRKYYGETGFISGSVPASEHSTMTSWGRDKEADAYRNMLSKFSDVDSIHKVPVFACVSDAYDIINAVENIWGKELKGEIKKSDTIVAIRPDCYSDDTEILTFSGWKMFKDISMEDKVASVDANQNIIFTIPNKIMEYDYSGYMYHFTGGYDRIDIMVTPNHRMVSLNDKKKIPEVEIDFAENIKLNHRKFLTSANTTVSGEDITPFERFLVAFQADGSFSSRKDKLTGDIKNINGGKVHLCDHITVRFTFTKERKILRLIEILKESKLTYSINDELSKPNQKVFYVNIPRNMVLHKTLSWICPTTRSVIWLNSFLDELSYWDSTIRNDGRFSYSTTVEENVDPVLTAASLAGRTTSYRIDKDDRKDIFNDVHVISVVKNNEIGQRSINVEKINYDGKVYCVNVDTGMILVRRNKKTLVCGNSGSPLYMVMMTIDKLNKAFGHTVNSKGFKVLNNVRVVQGDGVDYESIKEIIDYIIMSGYSIDNIVFGMGGALHQKVNRDTQKFALKCSAVEVDGEWRDVYKDPITDKGKMSKKGRLDTYWDYTKAKSVTISAPAETVNAESILHDVFVNGDIIEENMNTFSDIKKTVRRFTPRV